MAAYERGGSSQVNINKELAVDVDGHLDPLTRCALSEDSICGVRTIVAPHACDVNDPHFRRKNLTKNPPCECALWSYSYTFHCVIHYMCVRAQSFPSL